MRSPENFAISVSLLENPSFVNFRFRKIFSKAARLENKCFRKCGEYIS